MAATIRAALEKAGIEVDAPKIAASSAAPTRPRLTRHAIECYVEVVKPAISTTIARQELQILVDEAEVIDQPPAWAGPRYPFYAVISDGIVGAISATGKVVTILNRGWVSDQARSARRQRRAWEREMRRARGRRESRSSRGCRRRRPQIDSRMVLDQDGKLLLDACEFTDFH